MVEHPKPHGDKLTALLQNEKLPKQDLTRVESAGLRYRDWITQLRGVAGSSDEIINQMVRSLNEYKLFIDIDLVFDSDNDFLYRQKGQLKLDNSIIEEFIPWLITTVLAEELKGLDLIFGPVNSFSALRFEEGG